MLSFVKANLLFFYRECWCSNTGLNEGSVAAPEEECSFKCPGNLSQICGAGDRYVIFSWILSYTSADYRFNLA